MGFIKVVFHGNGHGMVSSVSFLSNVQTSMVASWLWRTRAEVEGRVGGGSLCLVLQGVVFSKNETGKEGQAVVGPLQKEVV